MLMENKAQYLFRRYLERLKVKHIYLGRYIQKVDTTTVTESLVLTNRFVFFIGSSE